MSTNGVPDAEPDGPLYCSFCNKDHEQVRKMVQGPSAMICDVCIETCVDIISDDRVPESQTVIPPPQLTARCALCRVPVPVDKLVPVLGRGSICSPCISAVKSLQVEDSEGTR